MGKLTAAFCKSVKQVGKHFDGGGLYLQVQKSGRKYWRYAYRFNGKANIYSCGSYPSTTLAQARAAHAIAKGKLERGIDPNAEKREARIEKKEAIEHLFRNVAFQWLEMTRKTRDWGESYYGSTKRVMKNYILPAFGERDIKTINALEVMEFVQGIDATGKIPTAHDALETIKRIFRHAVNVQIIPFSPAESLKDIIRPEKSAPMRYTLEPDKIGDILLTIDRAVSTLPATRAYMQILPMLFCRPTELRLAKWENLDFENATLLIEAEDRKGDKPFTTPLPQQAIAILKTLRLHTLRTGYIFANTTTSKPISESAAFKFRKSTGMKLDMTSHGWRHTASTLLHDKGYNSDFIEAQLSHKDKNTIRGTYNHAQYVEQRRAILQDWADYLEGLKIAAFERECLAYDRE